MVLETGVEAINHGIQYKVTGLTTGLKVTTIQPRGGSFEVNFPLAPTSIETTNSASLKSTTSYIVISYDDNLSCQLTSG